MEPEDQDFDCDYLYKVKIEDEESFTKDQYIELQTEAGKEGLLVFIKDGWILVTDNIKSLL